VIRLSIRVSGDRAEQVLAELLELAPAGVEEVALAGGAVEYAVYGAPGELPELPDLRALAGGAHVEISTSEIADDWQERWKAFHRPVLIAAGPAPGPIQSEVASLHVRPPWERAHGGSEVREIVIDPGQAFGTGSHPTTRMCLEMMLSAVAGAHGAPPCMQLDVGTGSGVLAIAGSLLGLSPVLALDNDPQSVAAAEQNARVNGAQIQVRRFDLRAAALEWLEHPPAPGPLLLTANLLRPLLLMLASSMACAPHQLIAAGLLAEEADEVSRAFASGPRMREIQRLQSGEWAALWLTRD
jgi:ribosomal protein L11 methyltransferase